MKSNRVIYFAYGANLDLRGMRLRCPGHIQMARAVLPDYRLVFRGVADIEQMQGEKVYGALYQLTQKHLGALDRFEGYPTLYKRKTVTVTIDDGTSVKALVYIMTDRKWYAPPGNGYLETIITGCRDWQTPEEYIRSIIKSAADSHFGGKFK